MSSSDLHGMVPDTNDMVLLLIDVINHLDFEGNEGCFDVCIYLNLNLHLIRTIENC